MIVRAPATVNATAEEVVDVAIFPVAALVTVTLNDPALVVTKELIV